MAGKYRVFGTMFDRVFRNNLNANFDDIDTDIKAVDTRVSNIVASAGSSNTEIVDARGGKPVLKDRLDGFDSSLAEKATKAEIANIGNASPKGVYATLTALQTAFPTGNSNIYLVTADGKWYYWSGSAWTAGGTYQSTGISDNSVKLKQTDLPHIQKVNNFANDTFKSCIDAELTYNFTWTPANMVFSGAQTQYFDVGIYIGIVKFTVKNITGLTGNARFTPQLYSSDTLRFVGSSILTNISTQYKETTGADITEFVAKCVFNVTTAGNYKMSLYAINLNSAGTTITFDLNGVTLFKTALTSFSEGKADNLLELYDCFGFQDSYPSSTVFTKASANNLLEKSDIKTTSTITCWGDSLTWGVPVYLEKAYPEKLGVLTGLPVNNYGVGGETVKTIAGRQGGIPMIVQPFTIPSATTSVEVKLLSADGGTVSPLLQAATSVKGLNPCYINGVQGTLSYSNSKYYFTRAYAGSVTTISRPTPLITDGMKKNRNDIVCIWMGQNGGYESDDNYLVQCHEMMIDYLNSANKKCLIIGLTTGNTAGRSSLEKLMFNNFGRHYINARAYITTPIYEADGVTIKSCYGLDDVGITPTSGDLSAISSGSVPPSLLSDTVHGTEQFYTIIANLVYKRGQELGYW